MFPEGERRFFLKVVDAQVTFTAGAQGKVTKRRHLDRKPR
jgi:hypothetical protein